MHVRFPTIALQASVLILLATACSRRSTPGEIASSPAANSSTPSAAQASGQIALGAQIYEQTCAVCHFTGEGSPVAPPLKGSPVVVASADAVATVILKGQQGKTVVDGKPFNGMMPAQNTLSDEEIAAVVAYVRKQFSGVDEPVLPATVSALR